MEQLQAQTNGAEVSPEPLAAALANLPLAIGADGVMVPFRPTPKTAQGKIRYPMFPMCQIRQYAACTRGDSRKGSQIGFGYTSY